MELIFFYVNQSRTKFIEKQGFNFSSRYKFSVEYDKGTYILKGFECENPLPQNFFDETGCITNVTAVVGENGSGKTTLLTKLLGYSGQVKDKDHAPEYDAFFAEEYEIDKAISIYWDGNDLVCYHNIDEFENDTELLKENRVFYLTQGSDLLANMIANDKGFFDISKICVSNSIYGSNSEFVSMGNLEQLSLNMNSMQGLGNRFFRRKIRTNNRIVGEYFEVQDIMANEKEMADFQRILDILYLDYIHSNKSGSLFAENVGKYLSVKFHTSGKILNDYYSKNMNDKNADKEWLNYYDCVNENIFKEFDYESVKNDICFHLYTNLLYELMVCLMLENENHVKNKKELTKLIEKLLEQVKRNGSSAYEVLASAYAEIQEYEKVLEKVEVVGNTLPPSDFGYEICGQLKYKDKNKEEESDADEIDTYQNFIKLIKKSVFERKYSFVLKYIDIQGIELASGERALLNFFSWIYFVPKFTQIMREEKQVIKDLDLNLDYKQLSKLVNVSNPQDSHIIQISVTCGDIELCRDIANSLMNIGIDRIYQVIGSSEPTVIDYSEAEAVEEVSSGLAKDVALGALLGIVLACGLICVKFMTDTTLKTEEDVRKDLHMPVLAVVPYYEEMKK